MQQAEQLKVNFYEAEYGWIRFKIEVAHQKFEGSFSHVFDPVPDLKEWLEQLASGAKCAAFAFDPEGYLVRFHFEPTEGGNGLFTISVGTNYGSYESYASFNSTYAANSELWKEAKIYVEKPVNRKQLISAFYHGLLDLAASDTYDKWHWEFESVRDRLCNNLQLSEAQLLETLLTLNEVKIDQAIFYAEESFLEEFPSAASEEEAWRLFYATYILEKAGPLGHVKQELYTPNQSSSNLDNWTPEEKMKNLEEWLREQVSPYNGTPILEEFTSEIIEQYLAAEN